jgi:hypothetical protein
MNNPRPVGGPSETVRALEAEIERRERAKAEAAKERLA